MENNELDTIFERVYNENLFGKIYNETRQHLTEVGAANFAKQMQVKSGREYANAFLALAKAGKNTPINLQGTLKPERYKIGDNIISGSYMFTRNAALNTFLIERVYEELLLAKKGADQKAIQKFFRDFKNTLEEGGIQFTPLNLVDYRVIAA